MSKLLIKAPNKRSAGESRNVMGFLKGLKKLKSKVTLGHQGPGRGWHKDNPNNPHVSKKGASAKGAVKPTGPHTSFKLTKSGNVSKRTLEGKPGNATKANRTANKRRENVAKARLTRKGKLEGIKALEKAVPAEMGGFAMGGELMNRPKGSKDKSGRKARGKEITGVPMTGASASGKKAIKKAGRPHKVAGGTVTEGAPMTGASAKAVRTTAKRQANVEKARATRAGKVAQRKNASKARSVKAAKKVGENVVKATAMLTKTDNRTKSAKRTKDLRAADVKSLKATVTKTKRRSNVEKARKAKATKIKRRGNAKIARSQKRDKREGFQSGRYVL